MTRQPKTSGAADYREVAAAPDAHVPVGRWRRDELDDIDEVAVSRAVDGGGVANLTRGERFLAVVELRRHGLSYVRIAQHLQLHPHQVYRYLHRAGVVATTVKVAS